MKYTSNFPDTSVFDKISKETFDPQIEALEYEDTIFKNLADDIKQSQEQINKKTWYYDYWKFQIWKENKQNIDNNTNRWYPHFDCNHCRNCDTVPLRFHSAIRRFCTRSQAVTSCDSKYRQVVRQVVLLCLV